LSLNVPLFIFSILLNGAMFADTIFTAYAKKRGHWVLEVILYSLQIAAQLVFLVSSAITVAQTLPPSSDTFGTTVAIAVLGLASASLGLTTTILSKPK
jgi:ABC-type multidrug transport system permease subunit